MKRAVFITGVGTVGSYGEGEGELAKRLASGEVLTAEVDSEARLLAATAPRRAHLLADGALDPWLPAREARRMSPASRMAVATSRMAASTAGLEEEEIAGEQTAVSLGTAFGSTQYTHRLLQQIREVGPLSVSPFLFMETVVNAHAGQVALAHSATGSNYTVSQREASGLLAVARAADLIATGRAARAFAGSVDEVSPIQHAALAAHGALADAPDEIARPFDAQRSGFLASEGATIFMMEDEQVALERGATLRARVRAIARANDASARTTDWGTGHEHLAAKLRARLDDQAVSMESIDRVVSGASGSLRGDDLEARTLLAAFGAGKVPPVLTPKAVVGEYGGGHLASAIQALDPVDWLLPYSPSPAPELGVRSQEGPLTSQAQRVLVTTLAAGGAAIWVVLERPN